MKEIINIFINDIKNISKQKIAIVILIGILIIPGIYAWFNIDSNWNPYDNTGNLPIAIVNKDKGVTLLEENLNMGDLMEESLKKNHNMKWIFTDEITANKKVDRGEYYGEIVIPEDFSQKIVTLFDNGEIKKPEFDFYVNQKKNPIAPIIVDKAVGTIQNTLNQNFVNAFIYKIIDTAENMDVVGKGENSTNELIIKLTETKKSVQELRKIMTAISTASNSTSKSLSAVRDLIPEKSEFSNIDINNIQDYFNSTYQTLDNNLSFIVSSINDKGEEINTLIQSIDSTNASEKLPAIAEKLTTMKSDLNSILNALSSIDTVVPSSAIADIENKIKNLVSEIDTMQELISQDTITSDDIENIKKKWQELNTQLLDVVSTYSSSIQNEMNTIYTNASNSLSQLTILIARIDESLKNLDSAMANLIGALNSTTQLSGSMDEILLGVEVGIDDVIKRLSATADSELYAKIVALLQNDPAVVADFISSPIETNEINLYSINSYGSKMAAFYTILACWVGCTLLISILKTDIKRTKKNKELKNYQTFFGRFIIFAIMAILQGFIIGIGDIIMQVQVVNYQLFLLTIMFSSLVFVLIVYSLTISLGKIGEAMAIVFMVLQVAGSGGTFPLELLPRFYQIFHEFMPFYPAMNALRETIGGFYENDYIVYMLQLSCHTIIPLLLGLGFRRHIVHIKEKADKSLEKTDIII